MQTRMLLDGQNIEVLDAVVSLVLVLVMDVLGWKQLAPEVPLHHQAVFQSRTRLHITIADARGLMLTRLAAKLVPRLLCLERLPAAKT